MIQKMKCHQLCLWVILFHLGYMRNVVLATYEEDSWMDPDAWSREQNLQQDIDQSSSDVPQNEEKTTSGLHCNAPKIGHHDGEAIALMYYKRLIAYLFKPQLFKNDKVNGVMSRAFIFTALPEQLELLKNLSDPRDLDSVLTEILSNARVPTLDDYDALFGEVARHGRVMGALALIWDIIKDLGKLLKTSEVQFLLGAASMLLLGWYCHRKYRIGIITLIIGAVICFGYFHTYLECNRKMESERMLEELARNEQLNPTEPRWYTPIVNFFTSPEKDAKQAQREFIKKSSQLNLNFCRPDHVFLLYANDLFLTQLQFLIDKCHDTIVTFRENLPFPLNYVASLLLVGLIAYIVKLTFKYILSPRAWAGVWHAQTIAHHTTLPNISTGTAHHEDRISGENLRLLLNAISRGATSNQNAASNTTATASLTQTPSTGSGVQELAPDALENGNADTASDASMCEGEPQEIDSPQKPIEKVVNNDSSERSTEVSNDKGDGKSKVA